jgi:hypothetical protein
MTTPPPFFCKNVILKGLHCDMVQECDSKGFRCVPILQRVDAKGFESVGSPTRRAFIGDLGANSGWRPNRSTDYSMEVIECQLVTE